MTDAATIALDERQREVVDLADDASAIVLGAAGTGKTATAVEIVADRIARGWATDEIVVLAGTRAAATRLRDVLARRTDAVTLGPLARTVPSLAYALLADDAIAAGQQRPQLLTGAEQDRIIAELLAGHVADGAGPAWPAPLLDDVRAQQGFRTELRDLMARATEAAHTAASLAELGERAGRPAWVAAASFIREYRDALGFERPGETDALDASELLRMAAVRIRAGGTGLRLVVVDDAQELTAGEAHVLEALAERGVRIIALGDPDTATGVFRGADAGMLAELPTRLGVPMQRIVLEHAWRHGEAIRAEVQRRTAPIGTAGAGVQRAARASGIPGSIELLVVDTAGDEVAAIARMLRARHVLDGVPWSEMAVIARTQGIVQSLTRSLAVLEVPTSAEGAADLRTVGVVRDLLDVLRVSTGRVALTPDLAEQLLTGSLGGLDPIAVRRVRRSLRQLAVADAAGASGAAGAPGAAAAEHATGGELLAAALGDASMLRAIAGRDARTAAAFADSLAEATQLATGDAPGTVEEVLWGLWSRACVAERWRSESQGIEPGVTDKPAASGPQRGGDRATADRSGPRDLSGPEAQDAHRRLDAVVALFAAAQRFSERRPDADTAAFVDEWAASGLVEDTLAARATGEIVHLGTPAALVGREFDTVVVAGVQDGVWPNLRQRGSLLAADEIADARLAVRGVDRLAEVANGERRMFAHAISRATTRVLVTAVDSDDEQPSPFTRGMPPAAPETRSGSSLTLRGLVGELRHELASVASAAAASTASGSPASGSPASRSAASAAATDASAAASALAALAAAGVHAAAPAAWAGLAPASTAAPLADLDHGGTQRVSPSSIEGFAECPLDWIVSRLAGGTSNVASSLGTIVHAAVETAAEPTAEALMAAVDDRWSELGFASSWESVREHRVIEVVVERLASYLATIGADGWQIADGDHERRFELEIGPAVLSGSIDWIERRGDGVRIVDLKTGKTVPSAAKVAEHPQLLAYQLAVARDAIDSLPATAVSEGARLVYPKKASSPPFLEQAPIDAAALADFEALVVDTARGMAGATFVAHLDSHCTGRYTFGQCGIHVRPQVTE